MALDDLFGIELPILQAPMAGVQGSALAVAVANAGGLGSLPAAMLGADARGLQRMIDQHLAILRAVVSHEFGLLGHCG